MSATPEATQSLYRAYRPQTFSELRGQAHVARTLANAVRADVVAHGYVFAGPRGTGKTSAARILAKALNCIGPDEQHRVRAPTADPCGLCDACRTIALGSSLDVIEMDAASNRSIDDVRELRDTVAFAPIRDRYKVYIIDEAHMLTREAFNALLKTLEEPPPNVVFVLATTEPHKLPDTIISRCQRFDFHRPSLGQVTELLANIADREGIEVDDEALETIAEHSQGGFRDAIGALDRLRSFADGRIRADDVLQVLGVTDTQLLVELTDIVIDRDTAGALAFVHRLYERGANYGQFIADLLRHLRRLFLLQHLAQPADDPALLRALGQNVGLHAGAIARLQPQAHQFTPTALVRFMDLLGHAQTEIKAGLDGRLQLELALVRLTRPHVDLSLEGLDERIRRLEEAVSHGSSTSLSPSGGEPHPSQPSRRAPAAFNPSAAEKPGDVPLSRPASRAAAQPSAVKSPTPASEPAPASTTAPSEGSMLEQLTRAWPRVLELAQARSGPLFTLLRDTIPLDVADGRLTIGVPSNFAAEQLREQGEEGAVANAVSQIAGASLRVTYVISGVSQAAPTGESPISLTDQQRIALIQQELDAELLTDEPD